VDSSLNLKRVPDAFIPYQRHHLLQLCLDDGGLDESGKQALSRFADLFAAYTHFHFHRELEALKSSYWCFDPDRITQSSGAISAADRTEAAGVVIDRFRHLARLANYRELSQAEIVASFADSTLIELNTEVNLDDFHCVSCFARGETTTTERVPRFFRKVDVECELYERVLLLLHFKDEEHFLSSENRRRGTRPNLSFSPGKIYAYFYKNVPKLDLELLFPNVKMSMTPKDKLLLSVPAVGAGAAALVKVLGKITLVLTALAITFSWGWLLERIPGERPVTVNQLAALSAFFTVVVTLAMLAFKQWDKYKNKRTQFLKMVSENLFFRNLASNQSVFHRMLDSAEEEECKEALLVYYHLQAHQGEPLTASQLDALIEDWMRKKFHTVIDFDIDGPVENLQLIRGKDRFGQERSLLSVTPSGHLEVLPLEDALHVLDYLWDNAYHYNDASKSSRPPAAKTENPVRGAAAKTA